MRSFKYSLEDLKKQKISITEAIKNRESNNVGLDEDEKEYFEDIFSDKQISMKKLKKFYDPTSKLITLTKKKKLGWFYYNNLSVILTIKKCSNRNEYKIVKTEYDSWDDPDKHYHSDCYDSDGNFKTQIKILCKYYFSERQTTDFLDLLVEKILKTNKI